MSNLDAVVLLLWTVVWFGGLGLNLYAHVHVQLPTGVRVQPDSEDYQLSAPTAAMQNSCAGIH